jgi:hypothetical protein
VALKLYEEKNITGVIEKNISGFKSKKKTLQGSNRFSFYTGVKQNTPTLQGIKTYLP